MENLKTSSKVILFFTILSGALWMGSYFTRLMISYQIFEGTNFKLRSYLNNENLSAVLKSFEPAILSTSILYIIFIIFFILFISTSKIKLKNNGWLFIIIVLILITMPLEIFLMTIDYRLITALNTSGFNPNEVLDLIIKRFKIFSSFPVIEMLCYFSVIYFFIFQPLTKKEKDKI
jgi:hypothetical protein